MDLFGFEKAVKQVKAIELKTSPIKLNLTLGSKDNLNLLQMLNDSDVNKQ